MSGIVRKKRLEDGTFSELEAVFGGETAEQKIDRLEAENTRLMAVTADLYERILSDKK